MDHIDSPESSRRAGSDFSGPGLWAFNYFSIFGEILVGNGTFQGYVPLSLIPLRGGVYGLRSLATAFTRDRVLLAQLRSLATANLLDKQIY